MQLADTQQYLYQRRRQEGAAESCRTCEDSPRMEGDVPPGSHTCAKETADFEQQLISNVS